MKGKSVQRRGFLGWLLGLVGIGTASSVTHELVQGATLISPHLRGVGVLYYPRSAAAYVDARAIAEGIQVGQVLLLPSDRDEYGDYLWDFRVEPADDLNQIVLERIDDLPAFKKPLTGEPYTVGTAKRNRQRRMLPELCQGEGI